MSERINKRIVAAFFILLLITIGGGIAKDDKGEVFDPFGSNTTDVNPAGQGNSEVDTSAIIPQVQFDNDEISMVFQIISDTTGWSIFPTEAVSKAKVSLWAKKISAKKLLETIVANAGFIYHKEDSMISVMTYDEYMQNFGLGKEVIDLKFAKAVSIEATIKPFLSKLAKSIIYQQSNSIVIYESKGNLKFIKELIGKLDRQSEDIVIEIVALEYADSDELAKVLQLMFDDSSTTSRITTKTPSSNTAKSSTAIYSVKKTNQLVVVTSKIEIDKIRDIIKQLDIYEDNLLLEVVDLDYADCEEVSQTLQKFFSSEDKQQKSNSISDKKTINKTTNSKEIQGLSPQSQVQVYSIARTNQLVIQATAGDFGRIKVLLKKLDKYIEPVTKNYQFIYIDASEIYSGLEQIVGLSNNNSKGRNSNDDSGSTNGSNRSGITLIEKTNSILVTGPPAVHRIMDSIVSNIDKPSSYEAGMIRIYKLENADVEEVAKTISELIETKEKENQQEETTHSKFAEKASSSSSGDSSKVSETEQFVPKIEARVSVSKSTNSIVVQATARQHRELEKLITKLDERKKQVLIEAMIVEISETDDFNFGMELGQAAGSALSFTSFGLSSNLVPTAGTRDITVNSGATASILRSDKIHGIIQTLKSDGKARITSCPQILVNDNAVGYINSIEEEPTMQTNQGETTTTTSFAGFVEAGTQFAITPHISENDYLRVEYQITINSFGTRPTDPSIPPPRDTSSIQSEATIPNGYTIVVGGLQSSDEIENVDKVPLLGDIPGLGLAFKKIVKEKQNKMTYLFISPAIMESVDFEDLKEISDEKMKKITPDEDSNESNEKEE